MLVYIKETERLMELRSRTGRPIDELVNEILDVHLDERKKNKFLSIEMNKLFNAYKKRHNMD